MNFGIYTNIPLYVSGELLSICNTVYIYRVAGEIFAVSIAQGGPAQRFMQEWCYEYLVSGNIKRDGVHDTEISPLIKRVGLVDRISLDISSMYFHALQ